MRTKRMRIYVKFCDAYSIAIRGRPVTVPAHEFASFGSFAPLPQSGEPVHGAGDGAVPGLPNSRRAGRRDAGRPRRPGYRLTGETPPPRTQPIDPQCSSTSMARIPTAFTNLSALARIRERDDEIRNTRTHCLTGAHHWALDHVSVLTSAGLVCSELVRCHYARERSSESGMAESSHAGTPGRTAAAGRADGTTGAKRARGSDG